MKITRKDPVRDAFSGCSTGNGRNRYYPTKGVAITAFEGILEDYGYHLDHPGCTDWSNDSGRETIEVLNGSNDCVGLAVISWFRMESGNYEFIGYLS